MNDEPKIKKVVFHGRWRVVFLSMFLSGIVALFIGWNVERSANNTQADKSRVNCHNLQDGFGAFKEIATDVSRSTPDPRVQKRWLDYSQKFAKLTPPGAESCNKQFPKKSIIPLIEGDD
jgi:hypothetical protein